MTYPNPSTALAAIIVDELARGGVGLVVASPGSRSTALVLAASRHPGVELRVVIDERSAAFQALGWAKATGRPAAVVTTSGTAVANLVPAVVEADSSSVPLIVVSADRPPEERGVGANQAIDQRDIFGRFVRLATELGPGEPHPDAPRWWRSAVAQALGAALGFGGRPGPVHLNAAFREPTVAASYDGRTGAEPYPYDHPGRPGVAPWSEVVVGDAPSPEAVERVVAEIARAERGVIVAGAVGGAPEIVELGEHLGWPVIATAASGLRGRDGVVVAGHHLVEHTEPDMILRFGDPGPSRRMLELVSRPIPQVVVGQSWSDPGRTVTGFVGAAPRATASALRSAIDKREATEWRDWWHRADSAVVTVLAETMVEGRLTEPSVAWTTGGLGSDIMVVASSMPIRDVEAFGFVVPPIVANRGASGIDGFVSTALGAARAHPRTLALGGDLSMLHDSNGFLTEEPPPCVFVVIDNGGGGIFSFLPQYEHVEDASFERLFGTPHHRDLSALAEFHGMRWRRVAERAELEEMVRGAWEAKESVMVIVETDRDENLAEHVRLNRLAAETVAATPPPAPPSSPRA
ncbi:MAG TPA: 2-succinyl-5-enolpyruvyl-6-hydroxy-3-cyclohexene-1-carboxylic-acid synthase [Acidimicrobiia bacterium]